MNYGYFSNGEIAAPVSMCTRFNDIGAWHTLSDEERAEHGWYPCDIIDEDKDQRLFIKVLSRKELVEGRIIVSYEYLPRGLYSVMEDRLELLVSSYNNALNSDVVFNDQAFKVEHIQTLTDACRGGLDVYVDINGLLRKLDRDTAERILATLLEREHNLLALRYELQEKIKNSKSPEDVLQVDIQTGFNKYLE